MTLQNEPLSNFKLTHISMFNDDIWFTFMSCKTYYKEDEYTKQKRLWVNTYSLQYSNIKDLIPYDNDGSWIVGFHKCQNDFRLDNLAYDFKQQTKKDLIDYLGKGSQTTRQEDIDKLFKI